MLLVYHKSTEYCYVDQSNNNRKLFTNEGDKKRTMRTDHCVADNYVNSGDCHHLSRHSATNDRIQIVQNVLHTVIISRDYQ